MRYIEIIEGTIDPEWQKGHDDRLKGEPDWDFLKDLKDERMYWSGWDYGKPKADPKRLPRLAIPENLKGIRKTDLNKAYSSLISGHCTDNVNTHAAREPKEAFELLKDALNLLNKRFYKGEIMIYRTIEVDNPEKWIVSQLNRSNRLGIFWSSYEEYVMQHEKKSRVLFCAIAGIKAVNWHETLLLTVDGVEDEIRLLPDAPITLSWTDPAPPGFTPKAQQRA